MNMMGPLMNPAGAVYGLIGTYSPAISQLMGEALQRLGSKKALVVHSQGLDELTPLGEADIVDVTPQRIKRYSLDPKELGIPRSAAKCSAASCVWLALQKQAKHMLPCTGDGKVWHEADPPLSGQHSGLLTAHEEHLPKR